MELPVINIHPTHKLIVNSIKCYFVLTFQPAGQNNYNTKKTSQHVVDSRKSIFTHARPAAWNCLPRDGKNAFSMNILKYKVKTSFYWDLAPRFTTLHVRFYQLFVLHIVLLSIKIFEADDDDELHELLAIAVSKNHAYWCVYTSFLFYSIWQQMK